jgi:hypothetical protein
MGKSKAMEALEHKIEKELKTPFLRADLKHSKHMLHSIGVDINEQEERRLL